MNYEIFLIIYIYPSSHYLTTSPPHHLVVAMFTPLDDFYSTKNCVQSDGNISHVSAEARSEGRSLDAAQERQGGPPGGFSAPAFNIPFQPNFAFNEFGSFLDGGNGFSQLISGFVFCVSQYFSSKIFHLRPWWSGTEVSE